MTEEQWESAEDLELQAAIALSLVCLCCLIYCRRGTTVRNEITFSLNCTRRKIDNIGHEEAFDVSSKHRLQAQEVSGGKRGAEEELKGEGGGHPDADSGLTSCSCRIVFKS
jgi:hypothetical protein